jgi:nucleoside-triphosphatase THEP1
VPLTLVTGPADCGKTSWCRRLARDRPGFAGVLEPKLYAGGRRTGYDLYRLATGESVPFARLPELALPDWEERAGPFLVSGQAAPAAVEWMRLALANGPEGLILDEIGLLELRGRGLAEALRLALAQADSLEVVLAVQARCLPELAARLPAYRLVTLPEAGSARRGPPG